MNSQPTILMKTSIQQTLHLADGRILSYAEYGDPTGKPLFFFHGGNDSRLEAAILDETAQTLGVRILAPDRPGYGRSTFQPNRTFLDWPEDVAQLADALGHHPVCRGGSLRWRAVCRRRGLCAAAAIDRRRPD